ncbi:MAG: SDR family NAD(P)-dependent oxidoreductase [Thermoanaerobaculia bacterium]
MNGAFAGKVALVAGGTGGLGRAVSLAFLEAGARVAVTYRKAEELAALKKAAADTSRLDGHAIDVTDETAARALVEKLLAKHSRIDILVNTVGGYEGGSKLWEEDARALDRMLTLNVRSGWALCRAVVPAMIEQKRGAIVNVAAKAAVDAPPGLAAYAAAKAAALAMLDSLAADLKATGVRANSILPSIIDTEANRTAMPNADFTKWPKPDEIARVILFLCSDEAKLIHGAAIPVPGNA